MIANRTASSLLLLLLLLNVFTLYAEAQHTSIRAAAKHDDDDDDGYDDDDDDWDDDYDDEQDVGLYVAPGDDRAVLGGGGGGGGSNSDADACEEGGSSTNNTGTGITTSTTTKKPGLIGTNSFGSLCMAFRALRSVVPMETLVRITVRHYRYDRRFRHAMEFIQTARFIRAAHLVENTAAYQSMLLRFEEAGVDVRELHLTVLLDCLLLPVLRVVQQQRHQQPMPATNDSGIVGISTRSLASYTHDIWRAVPHGKLRNIIGVQLSTNANFANFYRVMGRTNFRRDVLHGLSSKPMREATRVLRQNFINLRQLLRFVFRVFSMGPHNPNSISPIRPLLVP